MSALPVPGGCIAVIGGSACSRAVYEQAEQVGYLLAKAGKVVVCGGLGGVMEAACKGAKGGGGLTVGILPGPGLEDANQYVDIPIATGLDDARNVIVVLSGRAVIAVDGKLGTLSEIALALNNRRKVVALGTPELDGKWLSGKGEFLRAATPEEAVERALEDCQK